MSMKNMALMFGAMAIMRRLDQEEPLVLLYARLAYMVYVVFTAFIYFLLHLRIVSRRDTSIIRVPAPPKPPSFSDAMAAAKGEADDEKRNGDDDDADADDRQHDKKQDEDEKPKEEVMTVMEYDLRKLAAARKSWVSNACLLAAIHYKMESVSPLLMSSLMGLTRLLSDDPLFQIHLRGAPAVGPLKRPFTPPKNPLADMLKEMQSKAEQNVAASVDQRSSSAPVEDLHDDGDEDGDDNDGPLPTIADYNDDHIKGDFDDDDEEDKDN